MVELHCALCGMSGASECELERMEEDLKGQIDPIALFDHRADIHIRGQLLPFGIEL